MPTEGKSSAETKHHAILVTLTTVLRRTVGIHIMENRIPEQCPQPWDCHAAIPEHDRSDKTARHEWTSDPSTNHQVPSSVDGVIPNERVGIAEVTEMAAAHGSQRIEGIYAEAKTGRYWCEVDGIWRLLRRKDLKTHLHCDRGVSLAKSSRGSKSEMDEIFREIEARNSVVVISEIPHQPTGPWVDDKGQRLLNVYSARAMHPSSVTHQIWGPSGNFPFISEFAGELFGPALSWILAWSYRLYSGAYLLEPNRGQHLFIAGPPSVGKTLFVHRILGPLMGGSCPASDYLMTRHNHWNGELFSSPIWIVENLHFGPRGVSAEKLAKKLKALATDKYFEVRE